ncbi:hypothetical protein BDN70DRAFT_896620 [Pholiota conissans]|uniref:Uncharacterized protein n=1 Tax=Pholiota conissans TaxID=109636 RepID=A0A9P5YZF9_9AGAR|nr:hypothetical protein BDN70DRAFT_896620 [Pholiota conissans]
MGYRALFPEVHVEKKTHRTRTLECRKIFFHLFAEGERARLSISYGADGNEVPALEMGGINEQSREVAWKPGGLVVQRLGNGMDEMTHKAEWGMVWVQGKTKIVWMLVALVKMLIWGIVVDGEGRCNSLYAATRNGEEFGWKKGGAKGAWAIVFVRVPILFSSLSSYLALVVLDLAHQFIQRRQMSCTMIVNADGKGGLQPDFLGSAW